MHDIDNTLMEFEEEMDGYEYEEYEDEMSDAAGVSSESEEMELAAELLAVADDEELDMFLGKLTKKAIVSAAKKHAPGFVKTDA